MKFADFPGFGGFVHDVVKTVDQQAKCVFAAKYLVGWVVRSHNELYEILKLMHSQCEVNHMETMLLLPILVLFVGSSVYCHVLARNKKKNVNFWTMMGLIAGPLAIPFLLISK